MTTTCQRWRDRRGSYVVPDEVICASDYYVQPISVKEAKAFVLQHHYSGSYPACRFRFGLYLRYGLWPNDELVGVAVFSNPMTDKVLTNVFPGDPRESVELGRFVLRDDVPANAETWFFARCREYLKREGLRGIVAFSDDTPRATPSGAVLFPGHIGNIYQASNATYLGRGTARRLLLLPDCTVMSARAISKIRNQERGWHYAARLLARHAGFEGVAYLDHPALWLNTWLPRVTRPLRHPGNHKYAWSLKTSFTFAVSSPYPKRSSYV